MEHKIIRKDRQYHSGDFYYYNAICSCGKDIGSWSKEGTEELIKEHLKGCEK